MSVGDESCCVKQIGIKQDKISFLPHVKKSRGKPCGVSLLSRSTEFLLSHCAILMGHLMVQDGCSNFVYDSGIPADKEEDEPISSVFRSLLGTFAPPKWAYISLAGTYATSHSQERLGDVVLAGWQNA